jgi:hypothetical protein
MYAKDIGPPGTDGKTNIKNNLYNLLYVTPKNEQESRIMPFLALKLQRYKNHLRAYSSASRYLANLYIRNKERTGQG